MGSVGLEAHAVVDQNLPQRDHEQGHRVLQRQLGRYVNLGDQELAALQTVTLHRRSVRAEQTLTHTGEIAEHVTLILEGFAYRYKLLPDGRRQILGFLLPGESCEFELAHENRSDHSVSALSKAVVARIPLFEIFAIQAQFINIRRAFSLASSAERSILRHWLLNVGQRRSHQRIGNFLCEISFRLEVCGHGKAQGPIQLPLSQAILADTTGVTTVHANRVLQQLRRDGLIALRRHQVTILDFVRLAQFAGFDEGYLRERYSG